MHRYPRGVAKAKAYAALIPTSLCEVQAGTVFDMQRKGLEEIIAVQLKTGPLQLAEWVFFITSIVPKNDVVERCQYMYLMLGIFKIAIELGGRC